MTSGKSEQDCTDHADRDPETGAAEELEHCCVEVGAADRLRRDGPGDEQVHERRGDPVVQPTFDIEQSSHSGGHPIVLHDGRTESGVGGCHDGADGGSNPEPAAPEEERRRGGARPDRQWQADAEEASRESGIGPEGPYVHPGGIGKEDDGEGHLRQRADGRRVQVEVDDAGRAMGDDQSEHDEGDRGRDVPSAPGGPRRGPR